MIIVIDESGSFYIGNNSKKYRVQLFSAVLLNNKAKEKWLNNHSKIEKGCKINEEKASQIITDLISWKAKALSVIVKLDLISTETFQDFKEDFIQSIILSIKKQPEIAKIAILAYVEKFKLLSPQETAKVLILLELLENSVREYLGSLDNLKSVDFRKLQIIIDKQSEPLIPFIKTFFNYWINCRAAKKNIYMDSKSKRKMQNIRTLNDGRECLDLRKLIKKIKVESDDKYPVLKCADCVANFTRRAFIGHLQFEGYKDLPLIYKTQHVPGFDFVHFDSKVEGDLIDHVPSELLAVFQHFQIVE
ncbi:MAG: hypothetical protein K940chlam5_00979 [Candidatus Anoxychlamydiales bacterium]|nr:hypothetical protein [Candidatus Anoxychlamydiales bacterium]